MITSESLKQYLTKLNTERLEKIYMDIFVVLEEREHKAKKKKVATVTATAKVDTAPTGS